MKESVTITASAGILFILLHTLGTFLPVEHFWSVHLWGYFPAWVITILTIMGTGTCLLSLRDDLSMNPFKIDIFSGRLNYFLIPLGSALPFWLLRERLFFTGDGYLWLRNLETGMKFRTHEPLEYYIHAYFYDFSKSTLNLSPEISWALISVLCGVIFVCVAMLIAHHTGTSLTKKNIIFLSLVSTGSIQLFFGYVETYSILMLFTATSILFAIMSFKNKNFLFLSVFTFSLAVCAHPSVAAFSPAFIYLFIVFFKEKNKWIEKLLYSGKYIAASALPIVLSLLLFQTGGITIRTFIEEYSGKSHILPLVLNNESSNIPYSLLSAAHIIDIINEYMLIAPITFFMIFILILKPGIIRKIFSEKLYLFLFTGSLFYAAFCFAFNMEIGVSRDWDLFSPSAIPVTLLSILIVIDSFKTHVKQIGIIVISCCILHTLPWIILNTSRDYSLERFLKLTQSETWSPYAKSYAYDELRKFYLDNGEFSKALEMAFKAYEAQKSERLYKTIGTVYTSLALEEVQKNNVQKAEEYFLEAYKYNSENFMITKNLGFFYYQVEDYDKALSYYLEALEIEPDNVMALRNTAMLYYILEQYPNAREYLDKALELNEDKELERELLRFDRALEAKVKVPNN